MTGFIIHGGRELCGQTALQGAKNAVLPILAAAMLTDGRVELTNCPRLADVENMLAILRQLGCQTRQQGDRITLECAGASGGHISEGLSSRIRSSVFLLGPILGRFGRAGFTYPGGCDIGLRPVDLHITGLEQLGARFLPEAGELRCENGLTGAHVHLDYPSVGATENVMMAAVTAVGTTVIHNAAREPEIADLQGFINAMGGDAQGAGTDTVTVRGVPRKSLKAVSYRVMPDRIAAATWMTAAAAAGGEVLVEGACPQHVLPVIAKLREAGCRVQTEKSGIRVVRRGPLCPLERVETLPYPGFPTDMQPQITVLACLCPGTTMVTENVFENRFRYAAQLRRMGARIAVKDRVAVAEGVTNLRGASVQACDLRAGAALLIAGLAAAGCTRVRDAGPVDRGYQDAEKVLCALGADVERR